MLGKAQASSVRPTSSWSICLLLASKTVAKARMAYRSVKRAPTYSSWPYKEQLECRLANLEGTRDKFRADADKLDVSEPAMFLHSSYSCTACHAKGK